LELLLEVGIDEIGKKRGISTVSNTKRVGHSDTFKNNSHTPNQFIRRLSQHVTHRVRAHRVSLGLYMLTFLYVQKSLSSFSNANIKTILSINITRKAE